MKRLALLFAAMLLFSCNDVTGPLVIDVDRVVVIDSYSGQRPYEIEVEDGNGQVYCTPDGSYAYVPCTGLGDDVAVLDCTVFEMVSTISLEGDIIDLCLDDTGSELYCLDDTWLRIVTVPSGVVRDSIQVPGGGVRTGIVHRPGTDQVYVSAIFPDSLIVLDTSPLSVDTGYPVGADRLAFSWSGSTLYCSKDSEVAALDPDDGSLLGTVDAGDLVTDICVVPGSQYIYVSWSDILDDAGGVIEIDAATMEIAQTLDLGYPATALCYVPIVQQLYAGMEKETNSAVAAVDLPVLGLFGVIDFGTHGLQGLCAVPPGAYVLCSISYDNGTDLD